MRLRPALVSFVCAVFIVPASVRAQTSGPRAVDDLLALAEHRGAAYCDWLVRWRTTLETKAATVHAIGLAEVARTDSAMAAIRASNLSVRACAPGD